ncbi:MAG: hypothetical protein ACOYK6_06310 [Chthoniobacterales bacterium]
MSDIKNSLLSESYLNEPVQEPKSGATSSGTTLGGPTKQEASYFSGSEGGAITIDSVDMSEAKYKAFRAFSKNVPSSLDSAATLRDPLLSNEFKPK